MLKVNLNRSLAEIPRLLCRIAAAAHKRLESAELQPAQEYFL